MREIRVRTSARNQLVDITGQLSRLVEESGVQEGICVVFAPHTTAGLTVNEAADPSVARDVSETLSSLVPHHGNYQHLEGNADSHIKSVVVGQSLSLIVSGGRLVLGTWQGVFFCEFDGPRERRVLVKVVPG